MNEQRICDECGKVYKAWNKSQRFCSRKCGNRWHVRKWRTGSGVKRTSMLAECEYCGVSFLRAYSGKLFCSEKCYNKYYYQTVVKPKRQKSRCHESGV